MFKGLTTDQHNKNVQDHGNIEQARRYCKKSNY